MLKVALGTK